jgi:ribonuclease HII
VTAVCPTLREERCLIRAGFRLVAGIDESGRGAWAGPVSAAAVVLPTHDPHLLDRLRGVRDSKLCTAIQREALYELVRQVALTWAVSLVPASRIDEIGIVSATREAMRMAIAQLDPSPDVLLIDALLLPSLATPQKAVVKGDVKCLSVAAASIIAKVTRDRAMVALDNQHPAYGFPSHKGYGTPQHRAALEQYGPTVVHRWCYRPVAELGKQQGKGPAGRAGEEEVHQ